MSYLLTSLSEKQDYEALESIKLSSRGPIMVVNKNNRNYESKKNDIVDRNVWRKCQNKDKYYNIRAIVWYYSVHFGISFHRKILGDIIYSCLSLCLFFFSFLTMWWHVMYLEKSCDKTPIQNIKTYLTLVFQEKVGFFASKFTDFANLPCFCYCSPYQNKYIVPNS